jgi:hypothetical protein
MRVGQQEGVHGVEEWSLEVLHDLFKIVPQIVRRVVGAPNEKVLQEWS